MSKGILTTEVSDAYKHPYKNQVYIQESGVVGGGNFLATMQIKTDDGYPLVYGAGASISEALRELAKFLKTNAGHDIRLDG
jgi:hypothetical protein